MELVNEGTINASGSHALVINTGNNVIVNSGALEATSTGGLIIDGPVANAGALDADGGNITIHGAVTGHGTATIAGLATLEFGAASDALVNFALGASGKLILDQPSTFTGEIDGISQPGNVIDLAGFAAADTIVTPGSYQDGTTTLTIRDGSGPGLSLTLLGNYSDAVFATTSDSNGGVNVFEMSQTHSPPTLSSATSSATSDAARGAVSFGGLDTVNPTTASVTPEAGGYQGVLSLDPAIVSNDTTTVDWRFTLNSDQFNFGPGETVTQSYDVSLPDSQNQAMDQSRTISVSFGGPGTEDFIFHPGIGADTVINFDQQHDTIDFDRFANIQSLQQLASEVASDADGDAIVNLGHGDSVTLPGVTAAQFQAMLQSSVHLH